MSYDLLEGVFVVEVAQYGPDAFGGYLADMGATVVKIEAPGRGDPIRFGGVDSPLGRDGYGLLHLRWNRGKRSIALDLKQPAGVEVFRRLTATAQIVIEGMRGGVLERLGLGYDELRAVNPRLVYCSVSGFGLSGPYRAMGSHGPSFDAFGGLMRAQASVPADQPPPVHAPHVSVGMHAVSLYAALGALSALRKAEQSGVGSRIEIAAAECAAHWLPATLDAELNADRLEPRPGAVNADGRYPRWPRLNNYGTADGKTLMIQLMLDVYWDRFCAAVGRPELAEMYADEGSASERDAFVERASALFRTRTLDAWMHFFLTHDISGVPVNDFADVIDDPHFTARGNVYEPEDAPGLRLTSTPVRVASQTFSPSLAPALGADTEAVLAEHLGMTEPEIAALRDTGAIG